jgi:hypothetical protein
MDRVILLHFGESVSEQFELVAMRQHMLTFEKTPSLNELVSRVRAVMNVGFDIKLHRRYDMGGGGGNGPIHVMLLGMAVWVSGNPRVLHPTGAGSGAFLHP